MTPSLAVIIVTYNSHGDIERCLQSLAAHGGVPLEVIVFDNASPDRRIAAIAARHNWVRWTLSTTNHGFGPANNLAMRQTSAPTLLFLNPDTAVQPQAIPRLLKELERGPHIGAVGPRLQYPDGSFQRGGAGFTPTVRRCFFEFYPLDRLLCGRRGGHRGYILAAEQTATVSVDWIAGTCCMVRREVMEMVGGFPADQFLYFEDIALGERIREAGYELRYVPEAVVTHFRGRSVATLQGDALHKARHGIRSYLVRRLGKGGAAAFRAIVVSGCLLRLVLALAPGYSRKRDAHAAARLWSWARLYW